MKTKAELKVILPLLGGFLGIVFGLINVATAADEKPSCEFGEIRGANCYMGDATFCKRTKASTLFPGLVECTDPLETYCRAGECYPRFVDQEGKVKVYAYHKFTEISADLVVGKSPQGFSALYTRQGENLIPSTTHFWGCEKISLIDDSMVSCSRDNKPTENLKIADLKNFRSAKFQIQDLVKNSILDVCQASQSQGEGFLQFWSNRFRIGQSKYAVHLVRLEDGGRVCQFQTMSAPKCWRLLVDEKGVVCRNQDGDQRILEKATSVEVRASNFREWLVATDAVDKIEFTAAEIEVMEDRGRLEVIDRAALLGLRDKKSE
jgi:hypothetical protein